MEPTAPVPPSLSYASKPELRRLTILYRISLWCAFLPMGTGIAIFLAWALTNASFLEVLGLLTIFGGCIAFVVGTVCLIAFSRREFRGGFSTPDKILRRAFFPAVMLVLNFPLAFAITTGVEYLSKYYAIVLTDSGTTTITSFTVTGPDFESEIGPIPAKQKVHFKHHYEGGGDITYKMIRNGAASQGSLLEDYDSDEDRDGTANFEINDKGLVKK